MKHHSTYGVKRNAMLTLSLPEEEFELLMQSLLGCKSFQNWKDFSHRQVRPTRIVCFLELGPFSERGFTDGSGQPKSFFFKNLAPFLSMPWQWKFKKDMILWCLSGRQGNTFPWTSCDATAGTVWLLSWWSVAQRIMSKWAGSPIASFCELLQSTVVPITCTEPKFMQDFCLPIPKCFPHTDHFFSSHQVTAHTHTHTFC